VLVVGLGGQLVLVDATADSFQVVSRLSVFDEGDHECYPHPALVGSRLYLRGTKSLVCVDFTSGALQGRPGADGDRAW
jgi:hypothetical protein